MRSYLKREVFTPSYTIYSSSALSQVYWLNAIISPLRDASAFSALVAIVLFLGLAK
jgi:hypothetical protein